MSWLLLYLCRISHSSSLSFLSGFSCDLADCIDNSFYQVLSLQGPNPCRLQQYSLKLNPAPSLDFDRCNKSSFPWPLAYRSCQGYRMIFYWRTASLHTRITFRGNRLGITWSREQVDSWWEILWPSYEQECEHDKRQENVLAPNELSSFPWLTWWISQGLRLLHCFCPF